MSTTTPEFGSLREKIAWEKKQRERRYARFARILAEAHAAGRAAHDAAATSTMVVERHAHPLDDNSPVEQHWVIPEGPCGFAWVTVRPATSSFGRWLVKEGHATKSYGGGLSIRVRTQGQSYERKMAYAQAMAGVLVAAPELAGLQILPGGRLD